MSAAAEYDVLVRLQVSKENTRAMAGSTKGLRQGLAMAERDQQRMHRAELGRNRTRARESARATSMQSRLDAKAAAARKAAAAEAARTSAARRQAVQGSVGSMGNLFAGVGTGGASAWAHRAGAVITGILAAAVTAAMAKAFTSGFEDNIKAETFVGSTGTTLQLYNFNKGFGDGSDKAQFEENLNNARWYQQELMRIADASPGDIGQVTELFEGAIPGMAGITQDAKRITDLTQKVTYLAGTIGDFQMVGAQTGQILQGGAGSEFKTWLRLQEPIRKAGIELKLFKKEQKGGAKLTEAFNKLDPQSRLQLFEKGLEALGPEVANYFENSFDGITSQAKSSLMTIRREFGKQPFIMVKDRVRALNKGGLLSRGSAPYEGLMNFAGFLGKQVGNGIVKGIDIAERAGTYVGNNWQLIVLRAQQAGHYLVTGAKLAASLMAVRSGVGMAAGLGGGVLKGFGAIASATTSVVSMGVAAAFVAPALLAMGVVFAGAGIMFGSAIAYVISNLDTLSSQFMNWQATSAGVIDPLFTALDDLSAKFVAAGGYLLGAGTETDIFTGAAKMATTAVIGVTNMFVWLLETTADVIGAFASVTEFINKITMKDSAKGGGWTSWLGPVRAARQLFGAKDAGDTFIGGAMARSRGEVPLAERARNLAATVKGTAEVFKNAKADPMEYGISDYLYEKMNPMGPAPPPPGSEPKTPPKVSLKQNVYNTWNVRDTDPAAIVAAHNKVNMQRAAVPLKSAMALVRRR